MTKEAPMSNDQVKAARVPLVIGNWSFFGHWPLVIGHFVLSCLLLPVCSPAAETALTNDYSAIDAIFTKRCLECHDAKDPEANLVLESFHTLMKGGENGPAIVPGKSAESLLVKMIEGKVERE